MKNLVALALVLSLAFVLNNVCAAQENGRPMTVKGITGITPNVEGVDFVPEGEVGIEVGLQDCCPDPCTAVRRTACRPYMANPCNPCPQYVQTACTPCARPVCYEPCGVDYGCAPYGHGYGYGYGHGYGYGSCYGGYGYGGYGYGYGYGGYGYGCGYGYGYGCGYPYGYRTPIRNFLVRAFAPRPYIGYDAYYGPYGDCCGYGY